VLGPQLSEAARKTLGVDAALPLRGRKSRDAGARDRFSERGDFNAAAGLLYEGRVSAVIDNVTVAGEHCRAPGYVRTNREQGCRR
jgi:hypothetical protein